MENDNDQLSLRSNENIGLFIRFDMIFKCGAIEKKILVNTTTFSEEQVLQHNFDDGEAIMIETIEDIFNKVPPNAFNRFMIDLNNLYYITHHFKMPHSTHIAFHNTGRNDMICMIHIELTQEEWKNQNQSAQ